MGSVRPRDAPITRRRQQGGAGVMILAGIVNRTIIGPFKVDEGVKRNGTNYCEFLDQTFFEWYKRQPHNFKIKCIFMHDNVPSHASRLSCEFLERERFTEDKTMERSPSSPDLNSVENPRSIIKQKLYEGGKQYNSKVELWDTIQSITAAASPDQIGKPTNSMDKRLVTWIEKEGRYD
ncbi:uncharacterized protein LOC106876286 [Octopus bimaculoides]|uniref:uncharacterized protein LOC106876286 n=1 Tax=Octopus bimaculoides TaxID=37653 RepID=UPI00071CD566|nr:uncharacterized protein LOC106876286 [Octopus bimaculoides]|eukprot:XP_014780265.1 PREDICTED: uncharacterized protein LOC106876286 [Octopus bimaculoides]